MAEIVLGLGTSHSPQTSTPAEYWGLHADRDHGNKQLLGKDALIYAYDELEAVADPAIRAEITPEKWQQRHDLNQRSIAGLADALAEVAPDVLVVIGDDQNELFHDNNLPAVSIYFADSIPVIPWKPRMPLPQSELWGWSYGPKAPTTYPIHAELGRHLIESLMEQDFDIGQSGRVPEGMGVGHAWSFIAERVMTRKVVPMVPVLLNTYFAPNQPTPRRCYQLGQAIKKAISEWKSDARVGVAASGGLSHFVVDEELDTELIAGLREHDAVKLASLPQAKLNSGTSEIRNWIATGGAVDQLDLAWLEYVPC